MMAGIKALFAGSWVKLLEILTIVSAVMGAVVFIRQSGKQAERLKNYEVGTKTHRENMEIRRSPGTDKQLLDELRHGDF